MRELLLLLLLATILGCFAVMRGTRDPLPGTSPQRRVPWILIGLFAVVMVLGIAVYVRDRAAFSRQIALAREVEQEWARRKSRGPDPLPERVRISVTIAIPCTAFSSRARAEVCDAATHLPRKLSAATREEVRQRVIGAIQLEIRPTTPRGSKRARAPAQYVARGDELAPELLSDSRDVAILRSVTDAVLMNRSNVPAFFFTSAEAAMKLEGPSRGYDVRNVVLTTEAGREYAMQPVRASDRDAFVGRLRSGGES